MVVTSFLSSVHIMKKMTSRVSIFLTIAIVVAVAVWKFSGSKPLEVTVIEVDKGKVESVVTNTRAGTVMACRRARLAPITGGQIAKLLVREGAKVTSDQVLIEFWNEDIKARLLLAKQQALAAKARGEEACVNYRVLEKEAKRTKKLYKQNLASEGDRDRAVGLAEAGRASCKAAKDTAQVSVANVKVVEVALDRSFLRAPFDGIVAEVNGEVGEFITPSPLGVPTLPAVDLIDYSCIYIEAPIDEVDVPAIKPGMPSRISLDAFKDYPFPGKVRQVAPYVQDREKQVRTVNIEVEFENLVGEQNLLFGYSADVEVILEVKDSAIRIPTEAIFDGGYVYVYEPGEGTLNKREIKIGISNWVSTEIVEGLVVGDVILASANTEGIVDGLEVITTTKTQQAQ